MYLRFLIMVLSVFSLSFASGAADVPLITLGGEVGAADKASINRFSSAPYDSLAWIRADLTGEKASESDDAGWDHILFRPFKNYSGDISGRFIEIMAMNARGDYKVHPAFRQLLADAQKQQRPGGYFAASGQIDWQKPVDYKDIYTSTMMPALWGNARLLCGLVEASRSFPKDASLLATARRLGDFYVGMIPRFTDPARMSEYKGGDTYAAGYVTCYFPAMEGLVKLHTLTGERKYLETAVTMAAFFKQFDRVPIDHAHGMLCNQVSLVLLYEATKDGAYLERVEKRWDELVTGGYINPAGGIMEQCKVKFGRDEGCAIVVWLRLNLALGRVTGKTRYWSMAERTLHNHFLQNQTPKGGFGHRGSLCDQEGVYGFSGSIEEAVWCCTFHGQLGFVNLRSHLLNRTAWELTCHFAVDFTATYADGSVVSEIRPVAAAGEVLRQRIRLDGLPATVLRVRQPHWADAVTAVAADGSALPLVTKDGFCATARPVSEATFIYAGGIYAEDRHCKRLPAGPVAGAAGVIGYGPKLLAAQGRTAAAPTWPTTLEALKAQGLEPFSEALRSKECCFVSGPFSLAVSLPKGPALPVNKAKFHCFEKMRAGRIKAGRGWNVADFAMSVFNPSLAKPIKVTFALIADDPNFVYKNGQTGIWTRVHALEPDTASTDNVVQGDWYTGGKFPVSGDTNWTGRAEFSSDESFYAYILLFPDIEGPDSAKAIKKGEMVWSDEVQGLWDEERKQIIFPYTNYWQNDPYWLGGWHTRLILVNRSESSVVYRVSHRPNYWARKNKGVSIPVPLKEESIEVKLAPGERKAAWLEDLFGWPKGLEDSMEGRLCVTPVPDSAREKCEVKLYVLPDKVSVESLKEAEKKALSDDVGVITATGLWKSDLPAPIKPVVIDRLQSLPPGSVRLNGFIQDRIHQQAEYLFDEKTLAEMADAIRKRPHRIVNGEAIGLAEGEFWGKAVRALSHHYQYSAEPRLRKLLDVTVADLMSLQTPDGCISDTVPELQPYHSDMWDRKYTLLGLVNAYETIGDPKVLASAMKLADFTLSQVGPAPKVSIVNTSFNSTPAKPTGWFFGVESSSILEPMMRLHRLTGKAEYLDFARYIVEVEGCSSKGSIFEAMLAGKEAKDLIGGTACHTYNIISCFEGLMGYYRATGNEKWKEAALKLYANVLAKEIAIIGTCCGLGGASENFAHSALYQTCPKRKGLEACSAPRWMAFCRHLLLITGDSTFCDEYERSLYNAVWGSIRPDGKAVDYFTRLSGVRPDLEENFRRVFNGKSFTCCSYNVGDALALVPFTAVMSGEGGPVVNLYIPGTARVKLADGNEVAVEQTTDYPKTGEVTINVNPLKPARFQIRLRIPGWSKQTRVTVNGKEQEAKPGSYLVLDRDWVAGDKIALSLDMRCRLVRSPEGSPKSADGFRALVRGPIVLARDKRLGGNIHEAVDIQADAGGYVAVTPQTPTIPALVQFTVPTVAGGSFQVIDFATSGNTWDAQSERVTWIPRSNPAPEVEHKR